MLILHMGVHRWITEISPLTHLAFEIPSLTLPWLLLDFRLIVPLLIISCLSLILSVNLHIFCSELVENYNKFGLVDILLLFT